MKARWGVGILALAVLGWSVLSFTSMLMFQDYNGYVVDGSLEKDSYLGALIPDSSEFTVTQIHVGIRLLQVNGTYVPGNVSVCLVFATYVNTILNHFNDTTFYSPLFFTCALLNSSQDTIQFDYNQAIPTGSFLYCFGGNASTGAGWWNNNRINIEVSVNYQWQYVNQEPASIYYPALLGVTFIAILTVVIIIYLYKLDKKELSGDTGM